MDWRTTLLFLASLALANAGVPRRNQPRIINGEDAEPGEIPYQVSLQRRTGIHLCGGSILNENYVLTAAHCVDGEKPGDFIISAGSIIFDEPLFVHEVEKIIPHKKYDPPRSWKNDIALIKVTVPFKQSKYISFVPLPKKDDVVPANSVAVVTGWGSTTEGGPPPKNLQRANIYIADQGFCEDAYAIGNKVIYSSQICAHHPATIKGSCHGDSGGPLTVDGKIVGIVSWSYRCALSDFPTVYTRVSSFLAWIKENAV